MPSFRGTAFEVEQDGNFAPAAVRDSDGVKRYAATIILDAEADHDAMFGSLCGVTLKRAIGGVAVFPFVEWGVGQGSPRADGLARAAPARDALTAALHPAPSSPADTPHGGAAARARPRPRLRRPAG